MVRHRGARLARALLAASAVLAGCEPYVQGNGVFVEEQRELPPFVGVRVDDRIQALVTAGAAAQSVVVQGDANLVPKVRAQVRDDDVRGAPTRVLRLSVDLDDFDATIPVRAIVKVRELRYVSAAEEAEVSVGLAQAPEMVVAASGHSFLRLGGPGGAALHATLEDASLDAHTYPVISAEVALTNASTVELAASGVVTGTADGSSTVDNLRGGGTCVVNGGGLVCCAPSLTCPP